MIGWKQNSFWPADQLRHLRASIGNDDHEFAVAVLNTSRCICIAREKPHHLIIVIERATDESVVASYRLKLLGQKPVIFADRKIIGASFKPAAPLHLSSALSPLLAHHTLHSFSRYCYCRARLLVTIQSSCIVANMLSTRPLGRLASRFVSAALTWGLVSEAKLSHPIPSSVTSYCGNRLCRTSC